MLLNRVNEEVEYYVLTSTETPDAFVFTEDSKVSKIHVPKEITPVGPEYVFIYIGELRAHPNKDYVFEDGVVEFSHPMNAVEQIIVKIYTKHDSNVTPAMFVM